MGTKWAPHVAQPQVFIHEVEIVVQAFAVVVAKKSPPAVLVVPGLVGSARLQGRENPHQSRVGSPLFQDSFDLVFLAEVFFAHVVDRQTVDGSQFLGIGLDGVGQRLGKLGEVENPDPPFAQVRRHAIRVTKHR
jgi:hypothetical protein